MRPKIFLDPGCGIEILTAGGTITVDKARANKDGIVKIKVRYDGELILNKKLYRIKKK